MCGKILAPNAGIDMSNSDKKNAILYLNPYAVAEQIRRMIFLKISVHTGVILSDSSSCKSRYNWRGNIVFWDIRKPLLVTSQATADNIATIAN